MPLTDEMQLVSVDDHLVEHPNLWQDRLPMKYRESGPRVVEVTSEIHSEFRFGMHLKPGSEVWLVEDNIYPQLGLNAVAGKPRNQMGADPVRFEEMLPGCYDPNERIRDMDLDGVTAAMCFPSFPRFGGTLFAEVRDHELALLCTQAWNDYILDEWCSTAPTRFIPMVILPFWDIEESLRELERTAKRGARAISFPENPVPLGYPSFHTDHWDRLFSAIEDAEITLCLHFGSSGQAPETAPDAPLAVFITLMGCNSMYALVDLLFSPVFHRHPRLKVALSEGGIGWLPYILERADLTWQRHRYYQNVDQNTRPSDLYRSNIFGCFIKDDFGIKNRHEIGIDRITWECDYPHSDSHWPESREVVRQLMLDVPDSEVSAMVEINARKLFQFPRA
jgi:predicted TIM-barrel fold metal-dependent hydrolase